MPSKKKSAKKVKREKPRKTLEERQQQIEEIKGKLEGLGLSENFDGIKEFYKYCNDYVEKSIPWSGSIKLHGLNRIICAILTTLKNVECSVNLKYDKTV